MGHGSYGGVGHGVGYGGVGHGVGAGGAGGFGMSTPYGHPVTHPGFTTMGFPGHAMAEATIEVKNTIPAGYPAHKQLEHPIHKRHIIEYPSSYLSHQPAVQSYYPGY